MQCNEMQPNAKQCKAMQWSAVQCNAIQCNGGSCEDGNATIDANLFGVHAQISYTYISLFCVCVRFIYIYIYIYIYVYIYTYVHKYTYIYHIFIRFVWVLQDVLAYVWRPAELNAVPHSEHWLRNRTTEAIDFPLSDGEMPHPKVIAM